MQQSRTWRPLRPGVPVERTSSTSRLAAVSHRRRGHVALPVPRREQTVLIMSPRSPEWNQPPANASDDGVIRASRYPGIRCRGLRFLISADHIGPRLASLRPRSRSLHLITRPPQRRRVRRPVRRARGASASKMPSRSVRRSSTARRFRRALRYYGQDLHGTRRRAVMALTQTRRIHLVETGGHQPADPP